MADAEMADFLPVNGIGGVALEPLVEERLTRAAHTQRTAGDVFAEESVQAPLQPARLFGALRAAALLCGSALSCCVAACGVALLLFLLITRTLAPAAAHFQRDLYFDYTSPDVVAVASFLFTGAAASEPPFVKVQVVDSEQGRMARPRVLPPGQRVDVWLELDMPESNGDVFQVRGELLTSDGRTLASVSRPCLLPHRSPVVRMFRMAWRAPLELLGLGGERRVLRLPLFLGYRELRDAPFATFRATLQARARGGEVPRLYSAKAHVHLRLGPLRRIFYWARPGALASVLLALAALAALGGGGLTCAALLLLLLFLLRHAGGDTDGAPGAGVARGRPGATNVPEDVSSEAGCSEASSGVLDSDTGSERAHGDALDGCNPRGPSTWAPAARRSSAPLTADMLASARSEGLGTALDGGFDGGFAAGAWPRSGAARRSGSGGLGGGAMRRSGRSAPDSLAKRTLSGGFG